MSQKKSNHVVPSKSGWSVKKSGSSRASRNFTKKENAVSYARQLSRNEKTELYVHKKNGMIQERDSYGNDAFSLRNNN